MKGLIKLGISVGATLLLALTLSTNVFGQTPTPTPIPPPNPSPPPSILIITITDKYGNELGQPLQAGITAVLTVNGSAAKDGDWSWACNPDSLGFVADSTGHNRVAYYTPGAATGPLVVSAAGGIDGGPPDLVSVIIVTPNPQPVPTPVPPTPTPIPPTPPTPTPTPTPLTSLHPWAILVDDWTARETNYTTKQIGMLNDTKFLNNTFPGPNWRIYDVGDKNADGSLVAAKWLTTITTAGKKVPAIVFVDGAPGPTYGALLGVEEVPVDEPGMTGLKTKYTSTSKPTDVNRHFKSFDKLQNQLYK